MDLAAFNAMADAALDAALTRCLSVPRWVIAVRDGRPYDDWPHLEGTASRAASYLTDAELESALAGHPRIGEAASSPQHDAAQSAREQSGVDRSDGSTATALAEGNADYERRFGRVFLVRAAGRSSADILAELDRRLGNDEAAERAETVAALGDIAVLRLRGLIDGTTDTVLKNEAAR